MVESFGGNLEDILHGKRVLFAAALRQIASKLAPTTHQGTA
jgi:hypothetical protein